MSNYNTGHLAKNAENLSSDYDSAFTPNVNDNFAKILNILGYDAALPNSTYSGGGYNIPLSAAADFAIYDTEWQGYRKQRDLGAGGQDIQCNQFYVARTATMAFHALRDNTVIYKNGTSQATINAGGSTTVSCTAGDLIGVTRPVGIRSGNFDPGVAYMGWMGYAFAHRQDRYSGTTLFVYAPFSSTNVQLLYTTTDGYVTSLTSQATTTLSGTSWTQSMSTTRNYYLYANKPVIAYAYNVSGTGMQDTLPLYPMDEDTKFGAFSSGGHIMVTNNSAAARAGTSQTLQIFTRSSDGTSSTEYNGSVNADMVYTDTAPGKTSASLFQGPVQKVQSGNNQLFTCQQQADSNGGEMTPFVSKKAFGKAMILTTTADWATCIGESAMTVYRRDSNGRLITSQTMSGNATYSLYFTRFTNLSSSDVLETNGSNEMITYYDANTSLDDERVAFMSDALMELNTTSQSITTDNYPGNDQACSEGSSASTVTGYFISSFANGAQLFTDSTCRSLWDDAYGEGWYYNASTNQAFYYTRWTPSSGGVSDITSCGR